MGYEAMEVEGGKNKDGWGEEKSGCCSKIPCCKTCCRRVITCVLCAPIVLLCLFLIVILIWGASAGGQNPLDGNEAKATVTINLQADDQAAAVTALTSTPGVADRLMAGLGGSDVTLTFVSAANGAAKQQDFNVIVEAFGAESQKFQDLASILSDLQTNLAADIGANGAISGLANPDVASIANVNTEFPIKCAFKGITGNALSKPLCVSSVLAFLDSQQETVDEEIANNLPDYRVTTFGVEDGGSRVFLSAVYTAGGFGHTQLQDLDCDITADILAAVEDAQEFIGNLPGCELSFEELNCKVMLSDSVAYRDFDPVGCPSPACGCACTDGLDELPTDSVSAFLDAIQNVDTSAGTAPFNVAGQTLNTVC